MTLLSFLLSLRTGSKLKGRRYIDIVPRGTLLNWLSSLLSLRTGSKRKGRKYIHTVASLSSCGTPACS